MRIPLAVLGIAIAVGAASASQAATYDLAAQFGSSNPAGPWAYGYYSSSQPSGTFFPTYTAASAGQPLQSWSDASLPQTSVYGTPSDIHNTSNAEAGCCNSVVWLAGQATFHPGQNDEVASYRFTAPTAGVYSIAATFSGRDYVGPTDTQVQIVENNSTVLFTGIVNGYAGDAARAPFGVAPSIGYTNTLALNAGDRLHFDVAFDPAGTRSTGPFYYDTTGITATLTMVPEPASMVVLATGLLSLGVARRRRVS